MHANKTAPVSGTKVRIVLADDHKVMRQDLTQLISRQIDIQVKRRMEPKHWKWPDS